MTAPKTGKLLEEFCNAWRQMAEDCMVMLRAQDGQLGTLRKQLQEQTDRADYWHARAVATADQRQALKTAITHIDHMAAWITERNPIMVSGYSFEGLCEDMPGIRSAAGEGPK